MAFVGIYIYDYIIIWCAYPLVILRAVAWNVSTNRCCNGKTIYKLWAFHCHAGDCGRVNLRFLSMCFIGQQPVFGLFMLVGQDGYTAVYLQNIGTSQMDTVLDWQKLERSWVMHWTLLMCLCRPTLVLRGCDTSRTAFCGGGLVKEGSRRRSL